MTSIPTSISVARWLAAAAVVAVLVFPSLLSASEPGDTRAADTRPDAGDFTLPDLEGNDISLSDFEGKVVVVNFWATWCKPCLQELPHLEDLYEEFGEDGLVVLAVATDGPETRSSIRQVVRRKRWSMPVLVDESGDAVSLLNPRATNPFTVFIDRRGRVAEEHEGYAPGDEKEHQKTIETLLAEDAAE